MVCWSWRILGDSRILHNWYISAIPIHSVGDCLQPAVREIHEVLAVYVSASLALLVAEVVVGWVVIHGILPHVLCISLEK
jgi:hypothetical protein